ncbi:MAG: heme lyase CcmF/NrfE family subunit [Alphaproteobacteria bacterium]|nr:heme lyase CcmF/NrfE family subunit [Alphaproteobacteria bacterium]
MIPELGHFALILALFVALVQAVVPMIGASRGDRAWMGVASSAAAAQFALVTLAFGCLVWCYVVSDFSVLNVAQNSHTDKPLLYKITGVWGNHEGSMLLWVFILSVYGMAAALFGRNLPPTLRARALAVQGLVAFGFLVFILLTSNPFLRLDPAPPNGMGMNPLLQDPGLAFHPPFLYLGYVGFSMAYSFAVAALIEGRVDAVWARWVRPWVLAAWCFLTVGIVGGSWWAYYTLGWGGWWYWDPVENASLMPWLAGTALLHSLIVVERRDALKAWTILLTIVTFSLSLLGTFLVRSGVLTSVHSFAADPSRGVFILALLAGFTGLSLTLFSIRAPSLKGGSLFAPVSREGGLLLNNIFLSAAMGAVLLGTLYPLFMDVLELGKISVGPPYFDMVFIPFMTPVILAMALGPMLAWKRGSLKTAFARLRISLALAAAAIAVFAAFHVSWGVAASMGMAVWLFAGTMETLAERTGFLRAPWRETKRRALGLPRSFYGMIASHAGIAILIAGIAGSTAWQSERIQIMHIGDSVALGGYEIKLAKVEDGIKGPNYTAMRGIFDVSRNGVQDIALHPEKRTYDAPPRTTTKAATWGDFPHNLYAVLGDPDPKGGYVTRLYDKPLVTWIFFGGGLIALGGGLALLDRRYRVGAPTRSKYAGRDG